MKAIVKYNLIKKSHSGKSSIEKKFICKTLEDCIKMANEFISWRIAQKNYIRAEEFIISIFSSSHKNSKLVYSYSYKPTYIDAA